MHARLLLYLFFFNVGFAYVDMHECENKVRFKKKQINSRACILMDRIFLTQQNELCQRKIL